MTAERPSAGRSRGVGDTSTDSDRLAAAARRHHRRRADWDRDGERSVGRNLALIGALGWLVVLPALGGLALGRWLDGALGTGVTFAAAGLLLGVSLGFWLAWRRMHEE